MNDGMKQSSETGRFPALRYRDFRVLWFGMLFASGTMAFQYYAQMWLVYQVTQSAWALGMLGGVRGLAMLIFGLYAGALADRMDRRKLLLLTQTISLCVNLVLGLMAIYGNVELWIVFSLIFIGSATGSVDAPIRQALIPELVPHRHIPNAVALTTAAQLGSFALTPVLAGFVIASIGPGGAYLLSTIGNLGVLVALKTLHYRGRSTDAKREPVLVTIRDGVAYGRSHHIILWIILLNFVTAALGFALFLGPIVKWVNVMLGLGPAGYGLLEAFWGVGTLASSFTLSYVGEIRRPGRILVTGALMFGLSLLLFGLTRSLPVAAFAYIVNGAAWTAASIASGSIIQSMVPNEIRGRIMSLFMINGAVAQMNALLLGVVADVIGMEMMVPGAAVLCCLLTFLLVVFIPTLRHLDDFIEANDVE